LKISSKNIKYNFIRTSFRSSTNYKIFVSHIYIYDPNSHICIELMVNIRSDNFQLDYPLLATRILITIDCWTRITWIYDALSQKRCYHAYYGIILFVHETVNFFIITASEKHCIRIRRQRYQDVSDKDKYTKVQYNFSRCSYKNTMYRRMFL